MQTLIIATIQKSVPVALLHGNDIKEAGSWQRSSTPAQSKYVLSHTNYVAQTSCEVQQSVQQPPMTSTESTRGHASKVTAYRFKSTNIEEKALVHAREKHCL
jgi:hypothetical protein